MIMIMPERVLQHKGRYHALMPLLSKHKIAGELFLIRAADDDVQNVPSDLVFPNCQYKFKRSNPPSSNEWVALVTAGAALAVSITQGVSGWLHSKNSRHYRYKRGDEEWEAPSKKELLELIGSAGDAVRVRILPAERKR